MKTLAQGTALAALLLGSPTLMACATCLCGDPTLTTMGTEKPFAGRKRLSVDYLSRGETVGEPGVSEHVIDEERVTISLGYAPSSDWMFVASLPMVTREVERYDLSHEQGSGIGDLDLTARWFAPVGNRRHRAGLLFGARLPTSSEQEQDGTPIDFDAQPGAGATIANLGGWYGHYRSPWFFYSSLVVQQSVNEGYQGYEPGLAMLLTNHIQYALQYSFAVSFSLDARWKEQDRYFDVADEDSGGVLVMASPGISWGPVTDVLLNLSYQIPAIEDGNGRQEEEPTLRLGVTYDF